MRRQNFNKYAVFSVVSAFFMLILTLSLTPMPGICLTEDASSPRQGLCGTCKLSIANTGKVLYKRSALAAAAGLEPSFSQQALLFLKARPT